MKLVTSVKVYIVAAVLLACYCLYNLGLSMLNGRDELVLGGYSILVGLVLVAVSVAIKLGRQVTDLPGWWGDHHAADR